MAREAVKKTLRLEDDTWAEQPIKVEIAPAEFARGALRAAYRLKLHGEGGTTSEWVAKRYIKSVENENKLIEEDIKVQVLSKVRATIPSLLRLRRNCRCMQISTTSTACPRRSTLWCRS